jgi:phage baseplate assembly protein W
MAIKLEGLEVVFKGVDKLSPSIKVMRKTLISFNAQVMALSSELNNLFKQFSAASTGVLTVASALNTANQFLDRFESVSRDLTESLKRLEGLVYIYDIMQGGAGAYADVLRKVGISVGEFIKRLEEEKKVKGSVIAGTASLIHSFVRLDKELREKQKETSLLDKILEELGSSIKHISKDIAEFSDEFVRAGVAVGDLTGSFQMLLREYPTLAADTLMTMKDFRDFTASIITMGGELEKNIEIVREFGALVGVLGVEDKQVVSFIELAKASGLTVDKMQELMVTLMSADKQLKTVGLTADSAVAVLNELPELAKTIGITFSSDLATRFAKNVKTMANVLRKGLGFSIQRATGLAVELAKKLGAIAGDFRDFLTGLSTELSDETMGLMEILVFSGRDMGRMIEMLSDTTGQHMSEIVEAIADSVRRVGRHTILGERIMRRVVKIFGVEVASLIEAMVSGNKELESSIRAQLELQAESKQTWEALRKSFTRAGIALAKILSVIGEFVSSMISTAIAGFDAKETLDAFITVARELGRVIGAVAGFLIKVITPFIDIFGGVLKLFNTLLGVVDTFGKSVKGLAGLLTGLFTAVARFAFLFGVFKVLPKLIQSGFIKLMIKIVAFGKKYWGDMMKIFGMNWDRTLITMKDIFKIFMFDIGKIFRVLNTRMLRWFVIRFGKSARMVLRTMQAVLLFGLIEFFAEEGPLWKRLVRAIVKLGTALGAMFLVSFLIGLFPPLGTLAPLLYPLAGILGTSLGEVFADLVVPLEVKEPEGVAGTEGAVETGELSLGPARTLSVNFEPVVDRLDSINSGIQDLRRTVLTSVDINLRGDVNKVVDLEVKKQAVLRGVPV